MKRVISFLIKFYDPINLNKIVIKIVATFISIIYEFLLFYTQKKKKKLHLVDRESKNRIYERSVEVIVVARSFQVMLVVRCFNSHVARW